MKVAKADQLLEQAGVPDRRRSSKIAQKVYKTDALGQGENPRHIRRIRQAKKS